MANWHGEQQPHSQGPQQKTKFVICMKCTEPVTDGLRCGCNGLALQELVDQEYMRMADDGCPND